MAELPIIVLAFANEQEGHRYLRDLPEELRQLQAILEAAEGKGLCKLVVRPNAELKQIFDTFTEHRDRVAILHYGGHAVGDRLFLETTGTEGAVAHAEGLATFLGQRRNLQLVFLNGCSTRAQAAGLLDAGVAAVIATARAIEDAIALEFAAAFYSELASGATLRAAYEASRGRVLAGRGSAPQAYFRTRDLGTTDHVPVDPADDRGFPWELRLAPGAELDGRWSLPEAVGNPLFGLPAPSVDWLPETPYRGLQRFTRDESAVFFGRGQAIREIYNLVIDPGTRPVILYYGPTGVGKSSVLDAGLVPRLEHSHEVRYLRRDPDLGLLGTLRCGLAPGDQGTNPGPSLDLARLWLDRERPDRPLVVILDQAEEAFTRPRVAAPAEDDEALKRSWIDPDAELAELLAALRATFAGPDPARRPRGKLIVSFRNEWLDRFEQAFNAVKLGWEPMPLKPLEPAGIIEAIEGPAHDPTLKRRYELTVADGLAPTIAKDLVIDAGSALAPTLQVLLTNMWKGAGGKGGRFDQDLYRRLRDEGYLLRDVLEEGLKAVRQWHEDVESSGLALDVLVYHVTEFDTAAQRTRADLAARYPHRAEVLTGLLEKLKDGYLLIEADARSERSAPAVPATRLAHDTLAPLVHARFRTSIAPGQRARRLLENRAPEWQGGKTGSVLDSPDLASVEDGAAGMRAWTADEARLVEASRRVEEQRKAEELSRKRLKRNFVYGLAGAFVLAVATSIFAWVERGKAQDETRRANDQASEALTSGGVVALEQGHSFDAMHRFARAIAVVKDDDGAQANKIHDNRLRLRFLQTAVPHLRAILSRHGGAVNSAAFSPDGARIVTASDDRSARVWKVASSEFIELKGHGGAVRSAAFSQDGTRVVTASENTAAVYDAASGKLIVKLEPAAMRPRPTSFSPNPARVRVASVSDDATLRLHNASHGIEIVEIGPRLNSAAFSPDGTRVVTASDDGKVRVWEVASRKFVELKGHTGAVNSAVFSPDGTRIVTASDDGTARVWEVASGKKLAELGHPGRFYWAAFNANGEWVVTASNDGTARVWNTIDGKEIARMEGTVGMVRAAVFSPRAGKASILTAGSDGTARVWDVASHRQILELKCHDGWVNSTAFSPDGARIVTALDDGTVRVWDIPSSQSAVELKGHAGAVFSATFDREGTRVVTASEDCTARVYDAADGKLIVKLETQAIRPRPTSFSPNPARVRVASVSDDATLRLHKASHGRFNVDLRKMKIGPCLNSAVFSPDGTRVVTASDDRTAHVWEVASRKSVELKGHTRAVNSAVFSPDGARVVTASDDRTARVWEVSSGRSIELKGHAGAVRSAAFSPDGTRIVTTSDDRTARVWEVASGRKLAERDIGDTILTAAFAPDGARVVTTPKGKTTARVWEVESGRFVELKGHGGLVDSAVLSMDGSQVVTGSWDWSARAWEAASGRLIAEFDGHSSWVVSVALSPDGLRVLTASLDGTVRVWEMTSGRVIAVLEGHNSPVNSTAFSSDGTRVVTASEDKTCVWRLDALPGDSEALLLWVQVFTGTEFQNGVVRPISSAEWQARREKLLEYGAKASPSKWLDELLAQP